MFKKKVNNLDRIFDICLDRILIGGESIDNCIADYPEYRDELKSLLDISLRTQKAMSSIEARPDFKTRLRYELTSKMKYDNAPKRHSFKCKLQWVPVALSFCIVLLLSGGGTVAAASNSMPADPLYNVKLASEKVQVFFTFDDAAKADLYSEFVAERVNEIVSMAYANNIEAMDRSSGIMQDQLAMIYNLSNSQDPGAVTTVKSEITDDATLGVFSTVTVFETFWINGEETRPTDKNVTSTELQTSDTNDTYAVTVTKTVTVGSGGIVTAASESTTTSATITEQYVYMPPAHITNAGNQELIDTLYNNLMTLYMATTNNSGEVLESLLEAIAILEESYNIAISNVN
jgi:hypothetical protein